MKIVAIYGQDHKGSSYHIARMVADFLQGELTEFFLPRDLPYFCKGCYGCIREEKACPYYLDKNKIMQRIEEAEILLFSTPTYCLHASGGVKSFLDLTFTYWMPHKPRACMFSKKALVISATAGMGTGSAIKDISKALFFWGILLIKTYGVRVGAMRWEEVKEAKKEKIKIDCQSLAQSLLKERVRLGLKSKGLFYLMRKMHQENKGSSIEEKNYWQSKGWLGDKRPWTDSYK